VIPESMDRSFHRMAGLHTWVWLDELTRNLKESRPVNGHL
jgi:hypothetical protein